jgi:hypothetical protein
MLPAIMVQAFNFGIWYRDTIDGISARDDDGDHIALLAVCFDPLVLAPALGRELAFTSAC